MEFLDFLEAYQPPFSHSFAIICLLLSHLQVLGYLVKADNRDYWEPKLAFFSNILFFSNFTHFLQLFNSDLLTEIVFFLVQVLVFLSFLFFFLLLLAKRLANIPDLLKNRLIQGFLKLFAMFLNMFIWVFVLPILELYTAIDQCQNNKGFCLETYAKFLSVINIIFACCIAILVLWANRAHSFIEKGHLRMNFTAAEGVSVVLRVFLACFFYIFQQNAKVLIHLLVLGIFLVSAYNYYHSQAFSDEILSASYVFFIGNGVIICLYYIFKDFTNILSQRNLFYSLMMAMLYISKLSIKTALKSRNSLLQSDFQNLRTLALSLSSFYSFFIQKQVSNRSDFLFNGVLRNHVSKCHDPHCPVKIEQFLAFENTSVGDQNKIINEFVAKAFSNAFHLKKTRQSAEFEPLLLRFGSFITYHNTNPIHAFLDLEKVFSLNKSPSFYFKSIVKSLEKSLKEYIKDYDKKSKEKALLESKEMDVMTFAMMHKVKKRLNKDFVALLKEKVKFWEEFRDGFGSYDELFRGVDKMNTKVMKMNEFLKKTLKYSQKSLAYRLFPLKYLSILSCVFMNHLNEGVKIEDEIEKLRKREASFRKDILNSTSFFEDNVLFLQASFLDPEGFILESSKTPKLAQIFGYSLEELKSMRTIVDFMPHIFKTTHRQFIRNYINKNRNAKSQEKPRIETYAIDKSGFVFAAKLYLGHCFDYQNDFVFQSAIIKPRSEQHLMLIDETGDIQGMTCSFFGSIEHEVKEFTVKDLYLLNAYALIPALEEVIEKNKGFKDETVVRVRNKLGFLYIPNNLKEIVEIMKVKAKDDEEAKTARSFRSYTSSKSQKTDRSNRETKNSKNSKFLTKLFQTNNNLSQEFKNVIQRKYANGTLRCYEIMKELIDYKECRRLKINFDLCFAFHSTSETEKLKYCTLLIQRLSAASPKRDNPNPHNQIPSYMESKSQSFVETVDINKDPTLIIDSEIKSGFINMPPVNVFEFREPHTPTSSAQGPDRLFTTDPAEMITSQAKGVVVGEVSLNVPRTGGLPIVKSPITNSQIINELGSSNEERPRKEEDSLVESSNSQKAQAENEGKANVGRTSNEKIYDAQDLSSQSSSLSSLKKTYAIFNMMNIIQKHVPQSLLAVFFSRISEIVFILIFCIYILLLSKQYIYSFYFPLEGGLVNFSDIFNAYALSTTILFQNDLTTNNLSQINRNSVYYQVFKVNMKESFEVLQARLEEERKKPTEHQYQSFFKTTSMNVTNLILPKFEQKSFKGFMDKVTELSHEVYSLDPQILDNMESEYFISNFLPFNNKIEDLTNLVWVEFGSTNLTIFDSIQLLLILFVVFLFLLKFFEFYQLEVFYQHLVKIVNIFLRTNHSEAINEVLIGNETMKQISEEAHSFLGLNYAELLLNRKAIKVQEEDVNSNRAKAQELERKNKKRKKNVHLSTVKRNSMKPLSRLPRLMFSAFSYILIFCFLFFNYFYYSIVNDQILQLIDISEFFQNLYTLPSGIIAEKQLIIREKLFQNQFSSEVNKEQRIKELYDKLKFNTMDLDNSNKKFPQYTLFAIDQINKAAFTNLISGNICDVLSAAGVITDIENPFCESIYDGVFKKGILSVNNIFVNTINIHSGILNPNNTNITDDLRQFLKDESVAEDVCAIIYINQAMQLFYDDLQQYYQNGMLTQQSNLQIMSIVTTVIMGGSFIVVIWWYLSFCKRLYRSITMTLSMIPYDRLINDEQTVFLIKRFGKD